MVLTHQCKKHGLVEGDNVALNRRIGRRGQITWGKRCRICKNESGRKHQHKIRDAHAVYKKKWRAENADYVKEYRENYVANNPEIVTRGKQNYERRCRAELRDRYIVKKLIGHTNMRREDIKPYEAILIDVKRAVLKLKRGVNLKHEDKKRRRPEGLYDPNFGET